MTIFRTIIQSQIALSNRFDALLPDRFLIDGNQDFIHHFAPKYYTALTSNSTIYDIGGGKNPLIPFDIKKHNSLTINGLDIDKNELLQAPNQYYNEIITADITAYKGNSDADLVVCQSTLEHVTDAEKAMHGIVSCIKPNGILVLFLPSRRAVYALINRCLPQGIKEKLLYTFFPNTKRDQGFPAFYDKATIAEYTEIADRLGLVLIEKRAYYISNYFSFCFPLYFLWRIYIIIAEKLFGKAAAETFCLAFVKK